MAAEDTSSPPEKPVQPEAASKGPDAAKASSKTVATEEHPSKLSLFLKTAGEYKEFVALVAFCAGGIFWAFAYFATKEQLSQAKCVLNANIAFIQARMDSASLSQLLLENLKQGAQLEKPVLTPDEILKRDQLKAAGADITRKLADADTAAAQALNKLKSGDCLGN